MGFSEDDIDVCYKLTRAYPYFIQKFLSILFEQKLAKNTPKVTLAKAREEYGKAFEKTVKVWGRDNMPQRTRDKLITLIKGVKESYGEQPLTLAFTIAKEYLVKLATS